MKKNIFISLVLIIFIFNSAAQDTQIMLDTFKRNFEKADKLETKVKVLQDAISTNLLGLGPLYQLSLDYTLNNRDMLTTDTLMTQIAFLSVEQIKTLGYSEAKNSLWTLFSVYKDTTMQISVLDALSILAQGDSAIINKCINWLETQNNLFKSGTKPDLQVLGQMVKTLGELKDGAAFSALFSAYVLGYSDNITGLAKTALFNLNTDTKTALMDVVQNGTIKEKWEALIMGLNTKDMLSDTDKAEVAELALETAIYTSTNNQTELSLIRQIRYTSMEALSQSKWSRATPLAIEHFGITLLEYDRGIATKANLIEAIKALGNMGTHEAAERLTSYLQLVNSYTEHGKIYDEQIVLAVLNSLNNLGDKVAFADLTNTKYLNYTETIKQAARKAIDGLKW